MLNKKLSKILKFYFENANPNNDLIAKQNFDILDIHYLVNIGLLTAQSSSDDVLWCTRINKQGKVAYYEYIHRPSLFNKLFSRTRDYLIAIIGLAIGATLSGFFSWLFSK